LLASWDKSYSMLLVKYTIAFCSLSVCVDSYFISFVVGDDINRGISWNISIVTLSLLNYTAVGDGAYLKYSFYIHIGIFFNVVTPCFSLLVGDGDDRWYILLGRAKLIWARS
jgi:hypothetical protein